MSKQTIQDYEYYIITISDSKGLIKYYSFGNKSDKPLIANINCEYGTIATQLFKANEKTEYINIFKFLESSNAKLLINLSYYICENSF